MASVSAAYQERQDRFSVNSRGNSDKKQLLSFHAVRRVVREDDPGVVVEVPRVVVPVGVHEVLLDDLAEVMRDGFLVLVGDGGGLGVAEDRGRDELVVGEALGAVDVEGLVVRVAQEDDVAGAASEVGEVLARGPAAVDHADRGRREALARVDPGLGVDADGAARGLAGREGVDVELVGLVVREHGGEVRGVARRREEDEEAEEELQDALGEAVARVVDLGVDAGAEDLEELGVDLAADVVADAPQVVLLPLAEARLVEREVGAHEARRDDDAQDRAPEPQGEGLEGRPDPRAEVRADLGAPRYQEVEVVHGDGRREGGLLEAAVGRPQVPDAEVDAAVADVLEARVPRRVVRLERRVRDLGGKRARRVANFLKRSYLGRFPLVLAQFWTSDHPSGRTQGVDAFPSGIASRTSTLKRR